MFKIAVLVGISTLLFGVGIKVKKSDVLVSINTIEVKLKKGESRDIQEGSTLCYLQGKGKIAIPILHKQLKKSGRCITMPIDNTKVNSFIKDIKNRAVVAFIDSKESVSHATGTKTQMQYKLNGEIEIGQNQKELLIYSVEFGPLPIVLSLKDTDAKELLIFENEDNDITLFRISTKDLKTGMSFDIYDGFGELLMSRKITVEGM